MILWDGLIDLDCSGYVELVLDPACVNVLMIVPFGGPPVLFHFHRKWNIDSRVAGRCRCRLRAWRQFLV